MWQPRVGLAWDVQSDGRSVVRANFGVYSARQNMLTQVGSVTTNGVQQQTLYVDSGLHRQFGVPTPTWPGVLTPSPVAAGVFPDFTGVRVFDRDYENPRIFSANVLSSPLRRWSSFSTPVAKGQALAAAHRV